MLNRIVKISSFTAIIFYRNMYINRFINIKFILLSIRFTSICDNCHFVFVQPLAFTLLHLSRRYEITRNPSRCQFLSAISDTCLIGENKYISCLHSLAGEKNIYKKKERKKRGKK